jgi:hypothetical protein
MFDLSFMIVFVLVLVYNSLRPDRTGPPPIPAAEPRASAPPGRWM